MASPVRSAALAAGLLFLESIAAQALSFAGAATGDRMLQSAGAAVGFVTAAAAASWAGAAPGPGYCWYYADPSRTQGFRDRCP